MTVPVRECASVWFRVLALSLIFIVNVYFMTKYAFNMRLSYF
jgi:hypothetical protein